MNRNRTAETDDSFVEGILGRRMPEFGAELRRTPRGDRPVSLIDPKLPDANDRFREAKCVAFPIKTKIGKAV
jgi:hypothetical protein